MADEQVLGPLGLPQAGAEADAAAGRTNQPTCGRSASPRYGSRRSSSSRSARSWGRPLARLFAARWRREMTGTASPP